MIKHTRTRIEDLRRTELIEAAHRVFMQYGLTGMTTARICAEAGMSPGILSYYFKGKDEVLYAMVRMNNRALAEDVIRRLRDARTLWDRLAAIIEGNFPAAYFHQNVAQAWLSLCAASATNERYARLQRLFYRRLGSNLGDVLGRALPQDALRPIVLAVGVQIDGLWLRKSVDPALERSTAVAVILATLDAMIPVDARENLLHAVR
jgi:TetR/AcrR family transcriptional regulator, transcriptional repressor of bet genes